MIHKLVAFTLLMLGSAMAQAATVYLDPLAQSSTIGNTVSVALKGQDFTQTIEGGGVNLSFNPAVLQLNSVAVDTTTWEFFTTTGTINNTAGTLTDLTFSSFAGRSGSFSIAQLIFQTTGVGISPLTLTESTLNPFASGGALLNPPSGPQGVSFTNANIQVTAVPLPAAIWLWLSAMGGVFYVGKRRS
jgi:hypothetical protein